METNEFFQSFEFEQLCENVRYAHDPFEAPNRDTIERETVEYLCEVFGGVAGFDLLAIIERLTNEVY